MNNVAEFIKVRQEIEVLAKEMDILVDRKTMPQSKNRLDEARELLARLTAMADNDVQEIAVGRLTRLINKLGARVATLTMHKRIIKKGPVT